MHQVHSLYLRHFEPRRARIDILREYIFRVELLRLSASALRLRSLRLRSLRLRAPRESRRSRTTRTGRRVPCAPSLSRGSLRRPRGRACFFPRVSTPLVVNWPDCGPWLTRACRTVRKWTSLQRCWHQQQRHRLHGASYTLSWMLMLRSPHCAIPQHHTMSRVPKDKRGDRRRRGL